MIPPGEEATKEEDDEGGEEEREEEAQFLIDSFGLGEVFKVDNERHHQIENNTVSDGRPEDFFLPCFCVLF